MVLGWTDSCPASTLQHFLAGSGHCHKVQPSEDWSHDVLSGSFAGGAKKQRSNTHAAFLQRSAEGGGNHPDAAAAALTHSRANSRGRGPWLHAAFFDTGRRAPAQILDESNGALSSITEACAPRRAQFVSFVSPAEQAGHAHHTNGEEHEGGDHHAAGAKSEGEVHCEKATTIASCVDVEKGCVWSMDNVGDPDGGGSCSYTEPETWPHGMQLVTEFMMVPVVEGSILLVAIQLRQRARDIISKMGMDPSRSDLRRAVWLLPTTAAYTLTACGYFSATQHWAWKSTLYFLIQVVTSVGYGDMAPTQPMTKLFTVCHILLGICIVGGALGDELDNVIASRLSRLVFKVEEAADWQYTTSLMWPRILEIQSLTPADRWSPIVDMFKGMYNPKKMEAPNQAQVLEGLRRLGNDAEGPLEKALMRELFQGINTVVADSGAPEVAAPSERVILQDLRKPGERLRVLIPLMAHAAESRQPPRFTQGQAMEQFASGAMIDQWAAELFWPSLRDFIVIILVIGSLFGLFDTFLYQHNARTVLDSFYMAVVTTTTVGFGDITPLLPFERVIGSICMIVGCYYCNRYVLSSAELFAWKTELSMDLIESLPPGFGTQLQRLRAGGEDRASWLGRRLGETGALSSWSGDTNKVCQDILDEYDEHVALGTGADEEEAEAFAQSQSLRRSQFQRN